jgi:hypothetical protein
MNEQKLTMIMAIKLRISGLYKNIKKIKIMGNIALIEYK